MKDFRTLKVWEKSHKIVIKLYGLTEKFPKTEMFGLVSQIRRASASIPTNISEGCGRGSDLDFARFLQISMGSASELEYLILLSVDLKFISKEDESLLIIEIQEIKKMLTALINKIKQ
ncbi:four helix bundle protein [Bacteroidales bacterium OttesenSCG-928-K03]|nr:four helix bundle protein [Odoribacter sp. OttesenSCG-928-L07]MDL2239377.1 four helix bundle protein [Bacteroidales bacterium OttesenSCG-928-L14]MDL2242720.1 four helix bundle protein [Bacteroidales bacterium OttesenSCG-928-K03]